MADLRVLLVEDSENEALLILRALQKSQFTVTHQRVDSEQALRLALEQSMWDVILSDYALPGFSGIKAIQIVNESNLDIPVILVSGTINDEIAVEAMRAGAKDFFNKDKLARLIPAIERELREHEQRRQRRKAEDRTLALQQLVAALSSAVTPQEIARLVLSRILAEFGGAAGVIAVLQPDQATIELIGSIGMDETVIRQFRSMPLALSAPLTDTIKRGEPIQMRTMEEYIQHYPHFNGVIHQNQSHSMIALPLSTGGQVIGAVSMSFRQPHAVSAEARDFLIALTHHCAQALERAQLYEAERQARQHAENAQRRLAYLAESTMILSSTLDFDQILVKLCDLVAPYLADACQISMLQSDGSIKPQIVHHIDPTKNTLLNEMLQQYPEYLGQQHGVGQVIETQQPEIVPVFTPEMMRAYATDERHLAMLEAINLTSYIVMPLIAHDQTFGAIAVAISGSDRQFTEDDRLLLQELAHRASIALENARLYAAAQQVAVLEERNRLSRDLHDAVTQILFSSSVISESLPRMKDKHPEQLWENIAYLHRLNRGALAEMRNLLMELRIGSIEATPMKSLLTQLAYAAMGRYPVDIQFELEPKLSPPADVKVAFYRITQEGLNNIVKHAQATQAQLSYTVNENHYALVLSDNGTGFDADQPRRLKGIQHMRECASEVGATFDLTSQPGQGTEIRVEWFAPLQTTQVQ